MEDYSGPEVYPPTSWMAQCKALVKHPQVWSLIEDEWPWLESWDSGLTPVQSVGCALLDVLAPEVAMFHMINPRSAPCCDFCGVILPGCTPNSHTSLCQDAPHTCPAS